MSKAVESQQLIVLSGDRLYPHLPRPSSRSNSIRWSSL